MWVALTNDTIWTERDQRLIGYRFEKGDSLQTIAKTPKGFELERFARDHLVDSDQLRMHTEKDGSSYVQVRDEATAWKLLSDWVQRIDGLALPSSVDTAGEQLARDVQAIMEDPYASPTERFALVAARLGQGKFREDLDREFGGRCAGTELEVRQALRASHIVPWSKCTKEQKIDPRNGILLSANLDALFDRHLITFTPQGDLLVSDAIGREDRDRLGPLQSLRETPRRKRAAFLRAHNEEFRRRDRGFRAAT